jgi:hypothetical protein
MSKRPTNLYLPYSAAGSGVSTPESGSAIFRCIGVDPVNFHTPVGAIGIEYLGQAPNPNYIGEAYSLAGQYIQTDSSATGTERVWECAETDVQTIDGVEYESCYARMYYASGDLKIDAQRLSHPGETGVTIDGVHMVGVEFAEPDESGWVSGSLPGNSVCVLPRFVGEEALWTGEKLFFDGSEWQGTGEIKQELVAVGYTPEVGKAYTVDTSALATLYPEEPAGPPTASGMSVAKITEYIPYRAEYTAITEINVSGIGKFGEEDYGEDFTSANGKYIVTPETADKSGYERVYKHESADYWIKARIDEWEEWGGDGWQFVQSIDSDYGFLYLMPYDLTSGTREDWENGDWGEYMAVTLAVTTTTFPEQPLVLNGIKAISYDESSFTWSWGTPCSFIGFEVEPKQYQIFAHDETMKLIGNPIGFDPESLLLSSDLYRSSHSHALAEYAESGEKLMWRIDDVAVEDTSYWRTENKAGIPCVTHNKENYYSQRLGRIWNKDAIKRLSDSRSASTMGGRYAEYTLIGTFYTETNPDANYINRVRIGDVSMHYEFSNNLDWGMGRVLGLQVFCERQQGKSDICEVEYGERDGDIKKASFPANTWVQHALVLHDGIIDYWQNGVLVGSVTRNSDAYYNTPPAYVLTTVGHESYFVDQPPKARGYVADTYAFGRALSPAEIKWLWANFEKRNTAE